MSFHDIIKLGQKEVEMQLPIREKDIKGFGYRNGQWTFYGTKHRGDDFMCNIGTPIYACADGVINTAGWNRYAGNQLKIQHNTFIFSYGCHFDKLLVSAGDSVKQGDLVAYSGNTGLWTTGPHLHFHIQDDNKYDSIYNYLKAPMGIIEKIVKAQQKKLADLADGNVVFLFSKGKTYIVRDGKKTKVKPTEALVNILSVGVTEEDAIKIPDNK